MQKQGDSKYINLTLLIILVTFVISTISFGRYDTDVVKYGDSAGYYVYLPALFIHHDFAFVEEIMGDGSGDYSGKFDGPVVDKYPCGVAVLQSPFFAVGHIVAGLTGSKQDGYSYPYLIAIMIAIIFYVMFGLYLLSKVLLKLFDETTTIVVLLSIALATNLYYFTVYNNQMAHGYSFFLISALIYSTVQWYENPTWRNAFFVGLSSGLIALVRPVDLLILSIPVFYGLANSKDFGSRWSFIQKHWKKYVFAILIFGMCSIPQLLYWKEVTGHWYYYSYRTEGFHFDDSHVLDGFIDGKNGWLRYTPIMTFALVGMIYLFKHRKWLWPVVFFFPLYAFVVYSWHNWFYINSFGSRPMVGAYALFAIPLGYFVFNSFKKRWLKLTISILFLFFLVLNIFQTYQELWGVSRSEYASNLFYMKSFGKTKMDYEMLSTYETNISQPYHTNCQEPVFFNTFPDSTMANMEKHIVHSAPYSVRLDKKIPNLILLHKKVKDLGVRGGQYIKISGYFYASQHVYSWFQQGIMIAHVENNGKVRRWNQMWINNKILAETSDFSLMSNHIKKWGEVHFYYKVPSNVKDDEFIKVLISNPHNAWLLVDDVQIQICDKI